MKMIIKFEQFFNRCVFKLLEILGKRRPKTWQKYQRELSQKAERLKKTQHKVKQELKSKTSKLPALALSAKEKVTQARKNLSIPVIKNQLKLTFQSKTNTSSKRAKRSIVYLVPAMSLLLLLIVLTTIYTPGHQDDFGAFRAVAPPSYSKYPRRTLKIMNVSIPIYLKARNYESLITDFYIRTDTVFAKLYLDHNQHKVRDRFYESTYRLPASFALNAEGKAVIKTKIKHELNQLLIENKVEGSVVEIYFEAPIGN